MSSRFPSPSLCLQTRGPLRFAVLSQPMPLPCPPGAQGTGRFQLCSLPPLLFYRLTRPALRLLILHPLTVLNSVDVSPCCADMGRKSPVDLSANSIAKRSRKQLRRDSASALPACVDGLAMWKGRLLQMH